MTPDGHTIDPTPNTPRSRAELFTAFLWLALQGFGGVLAVVQRELVEKRRWLTERQFIDDWAVAQILPGPNVVNLAIMLGARHFGPGGALAALAGLLLLPGALTLAVAAGASTWVDTAAVQNGLRGVGAVAAGLILGTGLKLLSSLRFNAMGAAACAALVLLTFAATAVWRVPLPWVLALLGSAACLWAAWRLHRTAARCTADAPQRDQTTPAP